jgi:hypothetical protein
MSQGLGLVRSGSSDEDGKHLVFRMVSRAGARALAEDSADGLIALGGPGRFSDSDQLSPGPGKLLSDVCRTLPCVTYGYAYDGATIRRTGALLEDLQWPAIVS